MAEIVEVCRVSPPADGSLDRPESLPLTFFDIRWLRLLHIQRLYFYQLSDPETRFDSDIVPRLKRSLSLALRDYRPLAGTLTWPLGSARPILSYAPGDAVSLAVARSDADFHRLSATHNALSDAAACHPLVPDLAASPERAAVLAVQITSFPNTGFSIGLSMNHAALDGRSFVTFVKSWAYFCRSPQSVSLPPELRPSHDRSLVEDNANLGEIFSSQWRAMNGPDNRSLLPWKLELPPDSYRGTFQMPGAKLEKLRQLVLEPENARVSALVLTCAYTWACLVKAQGPTSETKTILDIPVDCRPRLDPPLPETYFGNCIGTMYVVLERERLLGKDGFRAAVKAISKAIASLACGVLRGAENWVSFLGGCAEGRTYYVVSSHRFEFYGVDFGWGRPRKVDLVSKYIAGVISLSDSSEGHGGVEFGLVLEKRDMEGFASFVEGLESL